LVNMASAELMRFEIDSSESFLQAIVFTSDRRLAGVSHSQDTPLVFGELVADITSTSVQFLSSTRIDFALQPEDVYPLPDGTIGYSPGQFSRSFELHGFMLGTLAGRDMSAVLSSPAIPLVGNSFATNSARFRFSSGRISYITRTQNSWFSDYFDAPG